MLTPTTHRFTLQPYAGPKSRINCPACDKPRCFTPYLDTDTGELLPTEYGRCDHESSCAYRLSPYTRPAGGGPSFATEQGERATTAPAVARRPAPVAPPPIVTIPADVFAASLGQYHRNNLAHLLRAHFGAGVAADLLARFQVGTATHWPGACVYWLIDEQGRVRGGEVVLLDDTGHTVKTPTRHTTWVHTVLQHHCQRRRQPLPGWLTAYAAHGKARPCLFGLPQLATAPAGQPVALVESAKTAIIATAYLPQFVWLATGGLGNLTAERLEPLRGRRIVLWPDVQGLAPWQAKADQLNNADPLNRPRFNIEVSDWLETTATPTEHAQKIDLADVLLREWPGYPPSWDKR